MDPSRHVALSAATLRRLGYDSPEDDKRLARIRRTFSPGEPVKLDKDFWRRKGFIFHDGSVVGWVKTSRTKPPLFRYYEFTKLRRCSGCPRVGCASVHFRRGNDCFAVDWRNRPWCDDCFRQRARVHIKEKWEQQHLDEEEEKQWREWDKMNDVARELRRIMQTKVELRAARAAKFVEQHMGVSQ